MNNLTTFILLLIATVSTVAQNSITGTVIDNNNLPIVGATIIIENTKKGTTTDIDGKFKIENITLTTPKLTISSIGYKTKNLVASVQEEMIIVLFEGNELLEEVVIDTNRKNKFSRKKTAYVAKLPLKNIENSQVYTTVTNQLLISQNVNSFEDALKNATGVDKLWASTGRTGDGAGFYSLRGFAVQPQLVNGMPGITNGFINQSNIERVEVIKGPSATLFGSTVSSYGGLINIVTKKPFKGTGGSINLGGGSFGFNKMTLDINTTDESEKFSLRLNAGFQNQDSWQDAGFKNSRFIAPSISYEFSDKVTFNFNYELSTTKQTNDVFLFLDRDNTFKFNTIEKLNYNTNLSFTNNDIFIQNPTQNYRGELVYKINNNITSQTIIAGGKAESKGIYTFLYNILGGEYFGLFAQGLDSETNSFNVQQNFTADFKIGDVRNRIVAGFDYLETQILNRDTKTFPGVLGVNTQGKIGNFPPAFGFANIPLTKENASNLLNNLEKLNTNVNQNIVAGYISNVVNILPELSVMAGIRLDRFNYKGDKNTNEDDTKEYIETTFSPKFGVVYQPILNKLSVFANYQNSFNYVNPEIVAVTDANTNTTVNVLQSYDLEEANQFEFGTKTNLFNNKLEATLSYYNISVDNKIIGFGPDKKQDGAVKSQGIELEINANPINGLNIRGGASYNDAIVTKSISQPDLKGTRFGEAGSEYTYNFWADYKFQNGIAKNFGLGAGFNGASDYDTMANYPKAGEFILPAYTVFNASVYYENNIFRASINANNITNQEYFKGWSTLTPQQPRAFYGSLIYKF